MTDQPTTITCPVCDAPNAARSLFCAECGTHIVTRRPGLSAVVLKIGTLDDPASVYAPKMAIFTKDRQPFHLIAEGIPSFDGLPNK